MIVKLAEIFRKNLLMHMGDTGLREFSRRANIPHPTLSRIINGESNPNLDTVDLIANGLKISPARLLGGSDERSYDIPQDILDSLDGQSPAVFEAVRGLLKAIAVVKTPASKNKKA